MLGGGINSPKVPVLIFILWAGLRFGLRGGTLAVFFLAVWAAFLTTHYMHGLSELEKSASDYVFTLQVYVVVAALVGIVPAIIIGEHNRTLTQLRESEERFRTLTEAAFEGVFVSENGIILDASDQGLRMFRYEREEMIGKSVLDLATSAAREGVAEAVRMVREGGQSLDDHELQRKDGSTFFGEAQAKVVEVGGRKLWLTALRDVTQRRRIEQALRESEEKYSKAFRASPDGLTVTELETGRYVEVNEGYCKLYGYSRDEMLGHTSVELDIWENLQDRARFVEGLKTIGTVHNFEARTRTRNGSIRIVHLSGEPIELGGKSCIVSVLRDVTDRVQAEQALRTSEESLRATIENTPNVAVQWYDRQGRVTYWNPASENMYGWLAAEAQGKTLGELLLAPKDATAFKRIIDEIVESGTAYGPAEFSFRRHDGSTGVILSTIFQIKIPSGEPRFVCMDVDLTQRKQAEEFNKSQRQILEMIASGRPMKKTLEALMRMVEAQSADILCTVLLLDLDGLHIRPGAAPSLPPEFSQGLDGMEIGPFVGSCGTAAFRREPVYVADVASDPLWAEYKDVVLSRGLRACWSTPIFDAQKKVLGTFAIYHREPGLPTEWHLQLISMVTHTAAICISRHRAETEREQAMAREQQARAEYTLRLIATQEAERKRISAELHDGIGQNLLLIKNQAEMSLRCRVPEQAHEQLSAIKQLAVECIAEARQISRDLHPYQLDHLGLKRALDAMLEHTVQASQIHFSSKFEPVDELFSSDATLNLYRIVQESLNNILKHSHARHVNVQMERDIHEVQLRIEDDGAGFVLAKAGEKKGLGLKNITERVRMLGGKLTIASAPGHGTRIEVTIPVAEKPAETKF